MHVADEQLALDGRERERGHEQEHQVPAVGDVLASRDAQDDDRQERGPEGQPEPVGERVVVEDRRRGHERDREERRVGVQPARALGLVGALELEIPVRRLTVEHELARARV